jgi:hypothetical protein
LSLDQSLKYGGCDPGMRREAGRTGFGAGSRHHRLYCLLAMPTAALPLEGAAGASLPGRRAIVKIPAAC